MADDKQKDAALKPIATIKKPVITAEKKDDTKVTETKAAAKKETKATAKKAPAKKTTTKKAAPKKTAETKAVAKKETKPAAKKPATKAAAKPAAKKAPAKKAAATTTEAKPSVFLQLPGRDVAYDTLVQNAKNVYEYDMNGKVSTIKTLDLYVKPEDNKVYFVINGDINGQFDL